AGALIGPKDVTLYWQRYLLNAWRRGRRAKLLSAVPYERLLPLPLEEVRRQLGIPPASEVHPDGILVGNRGEDPHTVAREPSTGWPMPRRDAAYLHVGSACLEGGAPSPPGWGWETADLARDSQASFYHPPRPPRRRRSGALQ